ncbi:MAG: hypothetical protein GY720_17050 [bacterium]|nr:hypothetical protein [bacterium]
MENFLVGYEYGSGTVWGYVAAETAQEVVAFLPEVDIWEHPPASLSVEDLANLAGQPAIAVNATHALDRLLSNFSGMNAAALVA